MPANNRHRLLAALLVGAVILTALLLSRILATVFFAVTVAYVLAPADRALRERGVPGWWSSAALTCIAFLAFIGLIVPIVLVVYLRRRQLIPFFNALPDQIEVAAFGMTYVADVTEVTAAVSAYLRRLAILLAGEAPSVAAKGVVFGFVVFALLLRRNEVRRSLLAAVPEGYRDIARVLHERTGDTLFALYVIQAATAFATFFLALVLFLAMGYPYPVTLAVLAGLLQFLPVVGPSIIVLGLGAYEASVGAFNRMAIVLLAGLVIVGFLPDALLRPRLARHTANLPASMYFVGFVGGVLSLGVVGIIAGPLIIAIMIELLTMLSEERDRQVRTIG